MDLILTEACGQQLLWLARFFTEQFLWDYSELWGRAAF